MRTVINFFADLQERVVTRFKALCPPEFEPEMEASYRKFYVKLLAKLRSRASLVAVLMWASFLLWDVVRALSDPIFKEVAIEMAPVRVLVGVCLVLFRRETLMSRFETDDAHASRVVSTAMLVLYGGMSILTVIAPAPYKGQSFFIGMMVCLVGMFSLSGVRTRDALFITVFVTLANIAAVASSFWSVGMGDSSIAIGKFAWLNLVFLVCFNVIGVTLCAVLEVMTRMLFESQHALAKSSNETARQQSEIIRMKEANRAEAVRRNREKSLFIASAVHDIRQPVQALTSAIPPLQSAIRRMNQSAVDPLMEIIQRSTEILRHQLGAILDISKIESGQVKLNVASIDLGSLLQDVLRDLGDFGRRYSVQLKLRTPPDRVPVLSDYHFLRRIVANLVENGIKYSDPARRPDCFVGVSVEVGVGTVTLVIEDNGIGIEGELLLDGRIFQPFVQLKNRHPEAEKGVGLGLAIVKGMIDRLPGHQMSVRSEQGVGSAFTLHLPLATGNIQVEALSAAGRQLKESCGVAGKLVILIEDDEMVRAATQAALLDLGALCESFADLSSLAEALEDIVRTPDILLTDHRLPDGHTAVDIIQLVRDYFGHIPTVVLSGSELPGFDEAEYPDTVILRKPIDISEIKEAIITMIYVNTA